ncbi:hypothetical protein [Pseudomonas sp. ML2-2023-6]|uniref:hypothetical protein n=1 Tax=Pseudomonas sp. ML2-2023-6 TaxID=3122376 RepID=UPI0030D460C7
MIPEHIEPPTRKVAALAKWYDLLRDEAALLTAPGTHHKALLDQAHSLHKAYVIDGDDLSDLLEQADGALAYAIESLIDHLVE